MTTKTRSHLSRAVAVAAAVLALAGCREAGSAHPAHKTPVPLPSPTGDKQEISSANLAYLWPLTVDHGTIECLPADRAIFVAPDGKAYALNRRARSAGYAAITPIRAKGSGGGYVSLGALLGDALKLCDK